MITTQQNGVMNSARRYLVTLLGTLGCALVFVLALNLALGDRGLGDERATRAASAWQQATRGVTYAPPVGNTRPFKVLRLADRLPEINAVVLGSSALMGIMQDMFPPDLRIYNMAAAGGTTAAIVGEVQYVTQHFSDRVRWMLVGLDWSIGMIYIPGAPAAMDLSPAMVDRAYASNTIPWYKRVEDALSWPRIANLAGLTAAALKSPAPFSNLRRALFDVGGPEYRCPDGAVARDYDVINRGLCRGFRDDGSWTYASDRRLSVAAAQTMSVAAAAPSSAYTKHLCTGGGSPHAEYLLALGLAARDFIDKRNGRMVFLLPPLVPGMERELRKSPRWGACLERTKSELDAWARRHRVTIIDAGASERYGCLPAEFADGHHAYPGCYARVLRRFFNDDSAGRAGPGLYTMDRQ